MALTLNTSDPWFSNIVAAFGVDDDNTVKEIKNGTSLTVHANVKLPNSGTPSSTAPFGPSFRTEANGSFDFYGVTFPAIGIPTDGKCTVILVVNQLNSSGGGGYISDGPLGRVGGSWVPWEAGTASATGIATGGHTIIASRDGDTQNRLFIDGVEDSAFSSGAVPVGGGSAGKTFSTLGGWAGQGYGSFDFVYLFVLVGVEANATDAAELHASATGGGAFRLISSGSAPAFDGPDIADIDGAVNTALTPVDVSGKFSGSGITYSKGGTWPAGVNIGSSTGIISGTPTASGTTSGCTVVATNSSGNVSSNAFAFNVSVGSVTTEAMENNTGSGPLASVAVDWEFVSGAEFGVSHGASTFGSGTTASDGTLTISGLPLGAGELLVRAGSGSSLALYFEQVTVA